MAGQIPGRTMFCMNDCVISVAMDAQIQSLLSVGATRPVPCRTCKRMDDGHGPVHADAVAGEADPGDDDSSDDERREPRRSERLRVPPIPLFNLDNNSRGEVVVRVSRRVSVTRPTCLARCMCRE